MTGLKMTRLAGLALASSICVLGTAVRAGDPPTPPPAQCQFKGDRAACFPYGCIPVDAHGDVSSNPDIIGIGAPGRCGPCTNNDQCGGSLCITSGEDAGKCHRYDGTPPPREVRPQFGLVVADVSLNVHDSAETRPIVSVGYLGQIGLGKIRPAARPDGKGFVVANPPRWYLDFGGAAAFAGPTQNLFLSAGGTFYAFSGPITTFGAGALYQRQGTAIWKADTTKNRDLLGPSFTVGFMQNIYLRAAYLFGLDQPGKPDAVMLSLLYMRDLFDDLLSDRFRKYLPQAMRGD
jgi:hypothetical protein